ncbi:WD repeat-containing protein 49-like [Notothenia coriiceps]|uniref:WD repeat-containing protein 49-like n=1 Tax=Notothenia coriiceps TaxID=8208 RepID=A0A6I9PIN0_9TELE|nr:PREDICTED: WD repeat-containing protein 49-like [Notothenia coriiceps]
MGTRMEVAQLEERMNIEDYRKLQGLFLDSSGSPRPLSRTEFVDLAWSSVGRGSKEEYGLLFDSVVFTQEHGSLLLDVDAIKEEERVDWGGLSSFLLQELSDKVKNSRTRSGPRWKPVRTLTCPHRDPVQKVLCLWDISRQLCVHRLAGVFPKTQEDTHTLLFLHEEQHLLFLSFNSLLLLLERKEEEERSSHEHPVTCVLYNSLFRQAVSSDSASSVICWRVDTGQKVKQFRRCHGNAEISTMALDGTQTRLFTAGADGEVKVWDFNGRCLHRMNAGLGRSVDISQVLLLRRSVLVMGWDRMFTVFRLHSFSQSYVEPSEWKGGVQHRSNVLCAAFQPPQTLVTGSYDGEIIEWNSSTENALKKLQPLTEHREDTHLGVNGKEDADNSIAVTRLFFIPGRTPKGGADLVSCGGSGVVRLWNSAHSRLVGQFTAHNSDLGSIVMTVSPCGKYVVTADREGTLKTWDIEHYYLELHDGITDEPPKLLSSFRPHLDRVMHLETCLHGNRLLVLSASSDCSVALSYLRGDNVGLFGQEEQWCLERTGPLHPQQEAERKPREEGGERSPPNETLPDPGTSAGGGEGGVKDEGEDCGSNAGDSRKHLSR